MKLQIFLIILFSLLFSACSVKELEKVSFEKSDHEISFFKDIKPILDNRCISCHSCYNSPCQLNLSSFEGIQRGGTKDEVYANRLSAANPTRLFIDAQDENQWRELGFSSMTDKLEDSNESIMMQYLFQKDQNPISKQDYSPETDKLSCVKNRKELAVYFDDNPHKGMPYGFPALKKSEYNLLMTWLNNGAIDDTQLNVSSSFEKEQILKFEEFLNNKNIKHQVSARYIYEHIFLGHIYFDENSGNFFELIRSSTPSGEKPQIIPTRFPYDEIQKAFYYRIQKIESTIVHKTHLVYKIDDAKLAFLNDVFIKPLWEEEPYLPSYDSTLSPNALEVFKQIPASSRYEFLLKDIYFTINNYIKGPVCKGQIALNVIQDHFWIMFLDPKHDPSVKDKNFLKNNFHNLTIPNQLGEDPGLFQTFRNLKHEKEIVSYEKNKEELYKSYYPNGISIDSIWKGNQVGDRNDAILTVYRHFDSASLHYGALGDIPKNLWVIDFPLLERVYYSLVAGFDIFGNTAHQLMVRSHMDRLRVEGESNFLEFLPKSSRLDYFNSWYQGWLAQYLTVYNPSNNETSIKYNSKNHKKEFANMALDYTNTQKDSINYIVDGYVPPEVKAVYNTKQEIEETFRNLSLPNDSKIIHHFTGEQSNTAHIRIIMNDGTNLIYTMVVNRWHTNVALLFDEKSRLDLTKDDIDFVEGFVGSYPNMFLIVEQNELSDFFNLLRNYEDSDEEIKKISDFSVNRADANFWEVFDWFENEFKKINPLEYGMFDLNKYYKKAINK